MFVKQNPDRKKKQKKQPSELATVTFFVLSLLKLCNESNLNLNYER